MGDLLCRLGARSPPAYAAAIKWAAPIPHPLFVMAPGPVAGWERGG